MIRVLVVDDHTVIREAFNRLCKGSADLEFAGGAASFSEALDGPPADLVLVDLGLVTEDDDAFHQLQETLPQVPFVLLTDGESDGAIRTALRAGAVAAVPKEAPVPHLIDTIRRAATGDRLHRPRPRIDASPLSRLTPREREVLALVAEGRTNREVAASLGISARTVSSHIASIYRKLQTSGRVEAARVALELGIEDPPSGTSPRLDADA